MPRTAAAITQADVARCIRAAKQAGAGAVEVRPDGRIIILMVPPAGSEQAILKNQLEGKRKIIL